MADDNIFADEEIIANNTHSSHLDHDVNDGLTALTLNGSDDNNEEPIEALYAVGDYVGVGEDQLSFSRGEQLKILKKTSEHWWWAESSEGQLGYVPVNHLTHTSYQHFYWEDEEYFGSYGKLKLHHEMLSDKARTLAYQHAIKKNAHLLKDKVILDVGSGSGILSLMCAKYGEPKQVYAVEASEMADYIVEIVKSNHLSHLVTVKHSYVEHLVLEEPADIIISEWMGTLLLFEMMLESVVIARDKYLTPGGTLWPSSASLFMVPVVAQQEYEDSVDFWSDQYGFDFSCLKSVAISEFLQKPNHSFVLERSDCLAADLKLLELDISQVQVSDLEEITRPFTFQVTKSGTLHGFCTWFQVDFHGLSENVATTFLNTGPDHELTHWKQNLFLMDVGILVEQDDLLQGQAKICRHEEWRRHIRLSLTFTHICHDSGQSTDYEKLFHIWR